MFDLPKHVFDRCGLASVEDFDSPQWRQSFDKLEQRQSAFLAREKMFRGADYPWPRDPLHCWSRAWEYPYAFHHLERWLAQRKRHPPAQVADLGSGVTFMPFAVADLGCRVTCLDTDPIVLRDLSNAISTFGYSDAIDFRQVKPGGLSVANASLDALYCISVLEHVESPSDLIVEIARALRPGGLFVLTIDLALRGRGEQIDTHRHGTLLSTLEQYFSSELPDRTVHPVNVLTNESSPFAPQRARWKRLLRPPAHAVLRCLGYEREIALACQGFVLTRRHEDQS